ncbi:MAG: very short patch repair endonuclease [Lachnospiraceae bacterium]|nr:very short patch repair endonuclease [Lachnospiraceae bacterium]
MKPRDPSVTSKIMSAIPSKDTRPEVRLRKALWAEGIRYRVNYKKLPGRPDIALTKHKIAIFCDGDFWHGHNWALRGYGSFEQELQRYSEYWRNKLLRNIERDEENNRAIRAMGWYVLRFWESDIKADLDSCVRQVKETIFEERINLN